MLTLRCFGGVSAVDHEGLEVTLRSRKHLGLLLYLVAHPRTTHGREELASLLWDGDGRKERHSLSQALYDIRSKLGPLLRVDANTVRLVPDQIAYEVGDFETALRERDHEAALDLYRGNFAPDLLNLNAEGFDRWLDDERERCRVLAALALRNAQRAAEERGDWDEMCLAALRLIKLNEFDEEAHCALMRGLWLKGDPASALAHFRSVERAGWAREALEIRDLAQLIARPTSVHEAAHLGRRRERVLGREHVFRTLFRELGKSDLTPRTVVLSGEVGVGKTALVSEFARLVEVRGGRIDWCFDWSKPPHLPDRVERDRNQRPHLIVLDSATDSSYLPTIVERQNLKPSTLVLIVSSQFDCAAQSTFAPAVDQVVHVEPLDHESCVALVRRAHSNCSDFTAAAAATLAGGHPRVAEVVAAAWVERGYTPNPRDPDLTDAATFALENSTAVRVLMSQQLRVLSPDELAAAAALADLSKEAAPFASKVFDALSLDEGLVGLKQRGWISTGHQGTLLKRPLIGHFLRLRRPMAASVQFHRAAADVLQTGDVAERCAAAAELEAARECPRALMLASSVARAALDSRDAVRATRAATVAHRCARVRDDRFRAGILLADAELDRGRLSRAAGALAELRSYAVSDDERLLVHLGLGRVAMGRGYQGSVEIEVSTLLKLADDSLDEAASRAAKVVVSALRSQTARIKNDLVRLRAHVAEMDHAFARLGPADKGHGGLWCDVFGTLSTQLLEEVSLRDAENLLARRRCNLTALGGIGREMVARVRPPMTLRAGDVQSALEIMSAPDRFEVEQSNRDLAVRYNNLGVAFMELGRFEEARRSFQECGGVEESIGSPPGEVAASFVNRAQCEFFAGNSADSLSYSRRLLEMPHQPDTQRAFVVGWALVGLIALQNGDVSYAQDCLRQAENLGGGIGYGSDCYLLGWLVTSLSILASRPEGVDALLAVAERADSLDRADANKARVLATVLVGTDLPESLTQECVQRMRSVGSGWFLRFARRWHAAAIAGC